MDQAAQPLMAGQGLPPRRKSLLTETGNQCDTCGKGSSQQCSSCGRKVCVGCVASEGICKSCQHIGEAQRGTREKKDLVSKFAAFFKSSRVKPRGYPGTPERGHAFLDTPASASKSGVMGFLRRGSSSSRNLLASMDDEAHAGSPLNPSKLPRSAARPSLISQSSESSDDIAGKLRIELDKYKEITTGLEQENAKLRTKLERQSSLSDGSTNTAKTSIGSTGSTEAAKPDMDLKEIEARTIDLQVQLQESQNRITQLGNDLLISQERERQLQEYVNMIITQQQQQQPKAAGERSRSAIPPCVPMPNTPESIAWLESIRVGTYQDYWKTAAATQSTAPALNGLPLPPALAMMSQSSNGKKRSEIPPPPPLPAGMAPAIVPAAFASAPSALLVNGRRGSAPGLLESVPHQKKRESVFAVAGAPKPELKPLFWTAMDQTKVQGTIFEKLATKPVVKPDAMNYELKALMTRFARRAPKGGAGQAAGSATAAVAQVQAPRLQIMDPKRKQQIGIGLSGSFRNVSLIELKKAIIMLDPHVLTLDRLKMLLDMIPTQEEITQMEGFRSGGLLDQAFFAGMCKEETFFVDMSSIPRLKQRLLCMLMEISFETSLQQLSEDLDNFAEAILIVRDSQLWKEFLQLCLETGNFLNEGNNGLGGAWGFSLKEGLKKFSEMKSCENNSRFSLMHWIAEVAAAHKSDLFGLVEEFGPVSDASTRSVEELKAEVNSIKRQLDIVKTEVEKSKMESSESSTKFLTRMVPFLEKTLVVEYARLQSKIEEIEKNALQLVVVHGESPQQTSCQQLFHIILEGVTAFLKCNEENQAAKLAEQKAQLQQQNSARKLTANPAGEGENRLKRDQSNRIMKDTGVATGQAKFELEIAMAKRRKAPQ